MSRKEFLPLIPVLVLLLVAANQIWQTNRENLSVWKGGGFGMFASVNSRFSHIHLHDKEETNCAEFPTEHREKLRKVETYPTYNGLGTLLEDYRKGEWIYFSKLVKQKPQVAIRMIEPHEFEGDWNKDSLARFDRMSLEVWNIKFDGKNSLITPFKIREMTLENKAND